MTKTSTGKHRANTCIRLRAWDFTGGRRQQKRGRPGASGLGGLPAPPNVSDVLAALLETSIAVEGRWVTQRRSERACRPVNHWGGLYPVGTSYQLTGCPVWVLAWCGLRIKVRIRDFWMGWLEGYWPNVHLHCISVESVVVGPGHTICTHLHLCDKERGCPTPVTCLVPSYCPLFAIPALKEKEFVIRLAQRHKPPEQAACCWQSSSLCAKLSIKGNKIKL